MVQILTALKVTVKRKPDKACEDEDEDEDETYGHYITSCIQDLLRLLRLVIRAGVAVFITFIQRFVRLYGRAKLVDYLSCRRTNHVVTILYHPRQCRPCSV